MKLRNKVLAGFITMVIALSMTVGTALATGELPAAYDEAAGGLPIAGQSDDHDVWVKITGGGTTIGDDALAQETRSVVVTITGNASYDLEYVYNSSAGWAPTTLSGESVDGEKAYTFDMNGAGTSYCEAIINLRGKSEGPLEVTRMDFLNETGDIILSHGAASSAAADTGSTDDSGDAADVSVPKTGVVSTALFLGLGAAVLGAGALVLKKKED